MKVKSYDRRTKTVLDIIQRSPSALSMPEISFFACMLEEYQEMEVRKIVWRLVSHNAVEMVDGLKFQSKDERPGVSPEWFAVMAEKDCLEAAQLKLKEALLRLVSD